MKSLQQVTESHCSKVQPHKSFPQASHTQPVTQFVQRVRGDCPRLGPASQKPLGAHSLLGLEEGESQGQCFQWRQETLLQEALGKRAGFSVTGGGLKQSL